MHLEGAAWVCFCSVMFTRRASAQQRQNRRTNRGHHQDPSKCQSNIGPALSRSTMRPSNSDLSLGSRTPGSHSTHESQGQRDGLPLPLSPRAASGRSKQEVASIDPFSTLSRCQAELADAQGYGVPRKCPPLGAAEDSSGSFEKQFEELKEAHWSRVQWSQCTKTTPSDQCAPRKLEKGQAPSSLQLKAQTHSSPRSSCC